MSKFLHAVDRDHNDEEGTTLSHRFRRGKKRANNRSIFSETAEIIIETKTYLL